MDLTEAYRVLEKYYYIWIPEELLLKSISDETKQEIIDGSISDTFAREGLIYDVLRGIGMPKEAHWPCNGDSETYTLGFTVALASKLKEVGGKHKFDMEDLKQRLTICRQWVQKKMDVLDDADAGLAALEEL